MGWVAVEVGMIGRGGKRRNDGRSESRSNDRMKIIVICHAQTIKPTPSNIKQHPSIRTLHNLLLKTSTSKTLYPYPYTSSNNWLLYAPYDEEGNEKDGEEEEEEDEEEEDEEEENGGFTEDA